MSELNWTLQQISAWTGGILTGEEQERVQRVSTDSREKLSDTLFIALVGERFDGHDFVVQAVQNGAAAVLIHQPLRENIAVPQIIVEDTLTALQTLGMTRRRSFRGPVAAITGSSGKTTTRRLLAAILSERFSTLQPIKNFNNHVGLPLTLLALSEKHQAAVLELGCSDFGEIALLTRLADPDVGLVTNVGPAHLEKLGDLNGVERAKGELFAGMRAETTAVRNLDDPHVVKMPQTAQSRISYGETAAADVVLSQRTVTKDARQNLEFVWNGKRFEANLLLLGAHNAINATAAAAAAIALGMTIEEISAGLAKATAEAGRLNPMPLPNGIVLIDDSYNANPASMAAALSVLGEFGAHSRIFAVLGDMLELGEAAIDAHLDIGKTAAATSLNGLICMGDQGKLIAQGARQAGMDPARVTWIEDFAGAANRLSAEMKAGDVVLIKGSRGMKMEQLIPILQRRQSQNAV